MRARPVGREQHGGAGGPGGDVQRGGADAELRESAAAACPEDQQLGVLACGDQRRGDGVVDLVGADQQLRVAHREDVPDLVEQVTGGPGLPAPAGEEVRHQGQGVQDAQWAAAQECLACGPVGGRQAGLGAVDADGDGQVHGDRLLQVGRLRVRVSCPAASR